MPMTVEAKDEAMVRAAGKTVGDAFRNYRDNFRIDGLRAMAYTAVSAVIKAQSELDKRGMKDDSTLSRLQLLDSQLDQLLDELEN